MNSIRHVAVVIPARDEAETIAATIESVERARRLLPPGVSSSCVVVVDASADATGTEIERLRVLPRDGNRAGSSIVAMRTVHGCVGAARSAGCRVALAGALYRPRDVWLANTDADTVVPDHWLTAQLELASRDVTAVAGTVELHADADPVLRERFAASYEVSSDGSHRHVHGANIGVRGDVYLLAGGWRRLASGEDHDLWARLGGVATCVSSTAITVSTSARFVGRAPHGFARDVSLLGTASVVDPDVEATVA